MINLMAISGNEGFYAKFGALRQVLTIQWAQGMVKWLNSLTTDFYEVCFPGRACSFCAHLVTNGLSIIPAAGTRKYHADFARKISSHGTAARTNRDFDPVDVPLPFGYIEVRVRKLLHKTVL